MSDNTETTTTSSLPETWDELTALPEMEGLPELVKPQKLNVQQSATLALLDQRVSKRLATLNELGVFDKDKPLKPKDEDKALLTMNETVIYIEAYFSDLAASKDAWNEWVAGRTLGSNFNILTSLYAFYNLQLGKSNASKTRSMNAVQE